VSDPAVAVDPAPSPEGHDKNENPREDGGHPCWADANGNPASPQQVQADEQGERHDHQQIARGACGTVRLDGASASAGCS
jgi:hypothetical protein